MAEAWKLAPSLVSLRAAIDEAFPGRSRRSDGSIGDEAHRMRKSDHNPDSRGVVHAIDVDKDLRPVDGSNVMAAVVAFLVARCRAGTEKRLTYIIYQGTIYKASNRWAPRDYDGANSHHEHAHFSASGTPALERSTASWHLEEVPVALTKDDKAWLETTIAKTVQKAVDDHLATPIGSKAYPHRTEGDLFRDLSKLRGVLVGDGPDTKDAALKPDSPLGRIIAASDRYLAEVDTPAAKSNKPGDKG